MTHALAMQTPSPVRPLTLAPKPFRDRIARYRSHVETTAAGKHQISALNAPNANELAEIEQRRALVLGWLRSAPIESVEKRMATIFLWFTSAGLSEESAQAVTQAYARVLSGFPVWAVDKACIKIRDSGARFRPSAPEIRKWVEQECAPAFHEAETLQLIITAERYEPRSEAERARVKAAFAQFIASLPDPKRDGRKTREEAEMDVAGGFAHLQGPIAVGDAFKAAIGARS
jgi:hypothetical protein